LALAKEVVMSRIGRPRASRGQREAAVQEAGRVLTIEDKVFSQAGPESSKKKSRILHGGFQVRQKEARLGRDANK